MCSSDLIDAFVRYVLFADEPPLSAPIEGSPDFRKAFESAGPRDKKGRSLRQLDLAHRLFIHPCSFLLQGEPFAALPGPLRLKILARIDSAIASSEPSGIASHISPAERSTLREILRETVPGYPAIHGNKPGS